MENLSKKKVPYLEGKSNGLIMKNWKEAATNTA
jgi:hypothetical protein